MEKICAGATCSLRISGQALKDAVAEYNAFFEALKSCFVGRGRVIDMLKYALLQRQHLLIFGPPGTSKTAIFDVMYSGIRDGNGFHTELSMFMTEDSLFGPYNPKKMREEGVLEHNTKGMLPEANVARLGEFLDANMPLLRSTLSALNERRLVRGNQNIQIPLITAYCDTNTDPGVFLEMHPEAQAVFDRFLFIEHVGYLDTADEITDMLNRFQAGKVNSLTKTLSIHSINTLARLTLDPPTIIKNQIIMIKMAKALQEYRLARRKIVEDGKVRLILPDISDRRFCWASQTAEVTAILDGRDEVIPEDILAMHHALGTTPEEVNLWDGIAKKAIEEIKSEMTMQVDHAQYIALESLGRDLEQIVPDAIVDIASLQDSGAKLKGFKAQIDTILPENDTIGAQKKKVEVTYQQKLAALQIKAAALTNVS